MVFQERDRKLLYALDLNSRQTTKEIGRFLRVSPQAVALKIEKFRNLGIIQCMTFVNTLSLGYLHYKVFLRLEQLTDKVETELIETLCNNKNIRWVGKTSGSFDLSFSVLAKTPGKFIEIYDELEQRSGKFIKEKTVALLVVATAFSREWLVDGKIAQRFEYNSATGTLALDETDQQILSVLSQNARMNVVEVAKKARINTDIARYRIRKMRNSGIISGFSIFLDLQKLGMEYYSVCVGTKDFRESVYNSVTTFAQHSKYIHYAGRAIGKYDIQLECEVPNFETLQSLLKKFRQEFSSHIKDFEVLRVIKEFKYNFYPF